MAETRGGVKGRAVPQHGVAEGVHVLAPSPRASSTGDVFPALGTHGDRGERVAAGPSLAVPIAGWLPGPGERGEQSPGARAPPALPGPRAHSCQQLLARRECVPGSPALSHLVFISFPKSLLLGGGCLVLGGPWAPLLTLQCGSHRAGTRKRLQGGVGVWRKGPPTHTPTTKMHVGPRRFHWVLWGMTAGCKPWGQRYRGTFAPSKLRAPKQQQCGPLPQGGGTS